MLHGNYGVRTKPPGRSCERQTDGKYILVYTVRTLVCGTPILLRSTMNGTVYHKWK